MGGFSSSSRGQRWGEGEGDGWRSLGLEKNGQEGEGTPEGRIHGDLPSLLSEIGKMFAMVAHTLSLGFSGFSGLSLISASLACSF